MFAVIHLSLSQATVRSLQVDLHGDLKWTETGGCRNRSQISGKWLAMIYTVSLEGQTGHLCFLVKRSHKTTKTSNMLICHHISWLVFSVAGSIMPFVSIETYIFKKWSKYTIWFFFFFKQLGCGTLTGVNSTVLRNYYDRFSFDLLMSISNTYGIE